MDIPGKIIAVLPKQSGVSQRTGNAWASQEYVIETHDQYPRKCCFRIFGEDKIASMNIQAGEELTVSFDIDASEYQGRWYNRLNAWKVERTQAAQGAPEQQAAPMPVQPQPVAPAQPAPAVDPLAGSSESDDLPF